MITSMATVKAVGETAMIPHFAVVCCCCTQLLVLETDLEEATGLSFGLPVRGKKKKGNLKMSPQAKTIKIKDE